MNGRTERADINTSSEERIDRPCEGTKQARAGKRHELRSL